MLLALPEGHRLAAGRSVRLEELRDEPWLGAPATEASAYYRNFVVRLCLEAGLRAGDRARAGRSLDRPRIIAAGSPSG
jgi:hypothetical protein